MITRYEHWELDDDRGRVDRDVLWDFLSTQAYWARWRERKDVEAQLGAAWRIVAIYRLADGAMVGYSRATSDGVTMAYLGDVFVVDHERGHGLGKILVDTMINNGPGKQFRWMLHTADAHRMYAKFGFAAPDQTYLERPSSR